MQMGNFDMQSTNGGFAIFNRRGERPRSPVCLNYGKFLGYSKNAQTTTNFRSIQKTPKQQRIFGAFKKRPNNNEFPEHSKKCPNNNEFSEHSKNAKIATNFWDIQKIPK